MGRDAPWDEQLPLSTATGAALLTRAAGWLSTIDSRLVLLAGTATAVSIGVADWLTRPELSLVVFYLIPLLVVAARCAPRTAVLFALAVAAQGVAIGITAPTALGRGVIVWNAGVRTAFYLLVVGLVVSLRALLDDLAFQAERDPLTHAPNRRAFIGAAERAVDASRRSGRPVTVLYLDVDGLKPVNDTIGHDAGDRLLRRVVDALADSLRSVDLYGRTGGDEFVILLPDSDEAAAREVVGRLRRELAHPFELAPGHPAAEGIAASFGGWVGVPGRAVTVEHLLQVADQQMYEAKRRRDGSVLLADGADGPTATTRSEDRAS